jgi:acyl carrier protein
MTNDEILTKVRSLLVDALSVDDDEVTLDARLAADLGAESIDMLDIVFRLEREFHLGKIDRNELFPESIFQGDPDLVDNGVVTPKGIEYLVEKLPYADQTKLAAFAKAPKLENIGDLFTVDLIVRYVAKKLSV